MPGVPSAEELSALPAAELAVRLEAYRLIGELTAQAERLSAWVGQPERQARRDSSTSSRPPSSRPPSSDSPYKKKGSDRSLRERGKRRPGDPGSTMSLVDDPDETFDCPPAACCGCGAGLAGVPVTAQRRHQVTDIEPAPGAEGHRTWRRRRSVPAAGRSPPASCPLRGKAAALAGASGFTGRVRELLKAASAVHADETPARAAGGTRYVHLTSALHAWCAIRLLRDLKGLYDFKPAKQDRAAQLATLLIEARDAAAAAHAGPGNPPWTQRSRTTWSPATGHWPPRAWPPVSAGAPPPRKTPAASPAGSSPMRT